MIQRLRQILGIESYEESLRNFALVLEQSEILKSEIDLMAKEYLQSSNDLNEWLKRESESEVQELVKSQQDGLTSRYLSFLSGRKKEYSKLEEQKKSFIKKYPHFEKALLDLKKNDFIEKTLLSYRDKNISLEECDLILKSVTKEKVKYSDNIVFNQKGELLIVQRAPLDENGANLWVLPGGHIKIGEDHETAAKRELFEETGYEVKDVYRVGEYDDKDVHIEYFTSMIDTSEQSPIVDAEETRYTEFIPIKDLYKYPTMYNIWDNVYKILGIEESIVKIKKAVIEGFVKSSEIADKKIDEKIGGDKKKRKFDKVMKEWKSGKLHSGGDGSVVTDHKQAIAIALSESGQSKEKSVENEFEKAGYISKYIGPSGKWVYTYIDQKKQNQDRLAFDQYTKDIRKLEIDLKNLFTEMETDPDIELSGGPIADEYGKKLDELHVAINKKKQERNALTYGRKTVESNELVPASLLQIANKVSEKHFGLNKAESDQLHGGKADKLSLEDIAKKHKVELEDIESEYKKGVKVESEHTDDEEKAGEIARDHLVEDSQYYTKLEKIEKSEEDEFEKAKKLGHLVPKKVEVKDRSGKIHYAIRWINPQTGEGEQYSEGKKRNVEGGTFEDRVATIISSEMSKSDKVRNLIDLGVYDTGLLTLLTGEPTPQYFLKQSDINIKELPDQSETIKTELRKEQKDNDTPQERTNNVLSREVPIEELWDNYERNLKRVITGRHKFTIAYGSGGVGKIFVFRQLAKKFELREYDDEIVPSKDQYDYVVVSGKITPSQVYAEMYRHRDKLIVFDDCDSFLSMDEVQGFLKAGLDTGETTKISNKSSKKVYNIEGDPESGTIPNTFSFKGRVIAITNLVSKQIDQAVKSRAMCCNLTMTIDETIEKLGNIKNRIDILTADKSSIIEVSQKARDYAFEVLKSYKDKLGGDINTRTYSNAVLIAHDAMEESVSEDKIKREITSYFDSVTGSFDEQIRKIKGK